MQCPCRQEKSRVHKTAKCPGGGGKWLQQGKSLGYVSVIQSLERRKGTGGFRPSGALFLLPEGRSQPAQSRFERVHLLGADQLGPSGADVGDRLPGYLLGFTRAGGREHELGAAVGGIGLAGDVAEPFELIDSVHDSRLGEPGSGSQLGDAGPLRADVLGDRKQRRPQVGEAGPPL